MRMLQKDIGTRHCKVDNGGYIEGKANCKAKATPHDLIEGVTIQMLNEVFIDNLDIVTIIKSILRKNIRRRKQ